MKGMPFSLSIDGSNDTGIEKMNPMTVKIFDANGMTHKFLDTYVHNNRQRSSNS